MEDVKIMDFVPYCKEYAIEHLEDYKSYNKSVYGADLGYELTECDNVNATITCSTWLAKQYLKEWWDEASDYFEYEKSDFGQNYYNPFEKPEAYMLCMVIQGVNSILSRCKTVDENWNEQFELTDEIIDNIISEIKEISDYDRLF